LARKFIGRKEIALINAINRELIQNVIGQEVIYYEILAEKTRKNDLYNEAINKIYAKPVVINALVNYENAQERITSFPPDAQYKLDVFFHTAELKDRNVDPKMGDFVQFGDQLFEIYSVTQTQLIFGQVEHKLLTQANCGPARKGQFDPRLYPMPENKPDTLAPQYRELVNNRRKPR
jgi:hypothetical protein